MQQKTRTEQARPLRRVHPGLVFVGLTAAYVLLGLAGLQLQSVQTGITPVWPPSGLAFAVVYWFGMAQLPALLPAMLLLGYLVGVPVEAALLSALGSMLEAGVPALLLRRAGVDPALRHLRDALLFIAIGPILGPVFSATVGALTFLLLAGSELPLLQLWLLWWLGNSIGFLLVGGAGLVLVARHGPRLPGRERVELALAGLVAGLVTLVGMLQVEHITSPLILYLLIPVFVLVAQRGDQRRVAALGLVVLGVTLAAAGLLPGDSLTQPTLGIAFLDVSLIWVVAFTGMVISAAFQERLSREQVSWLASHDPLTRLLNRHAFMQRLDVAVRRARANDARQVLMYLDLDRFKDLNDAEGHRAGDHVLRDIADILQQELRSSDAAARLGGDEFGMLLEGCTLLDAFAVAESIRAAVERYEYAASGGARRVEASIGLVRLGPQHQSPEDALHAADAACYEAKRNGRNSVFVAPANGDLAAD